MTLQSALPSRLADRYEVLGPLGRGGMADVYRALDTALDREVAVKVLRDAEHSERFRAEARTLAMLSHPGLVTVLDVGQVEGRPFLVMELVRGATLAECCQGEQLPPERVAAIGAQLAAALSHVHGAGVLHRDIKPGNVLLADDDRVLLADFGIARLIEEHATTDTGFTMGTAAYLSPEQVKGERVTPACDVYALGLVLLEALTGRRAYEGTPTEAASARLHRPPDVPEELGHAWHDLLVTMTSAAPEDRPDADQVRRQLTELAHGVSAVDATHAIRHDDAPHDATGNDGTRLYTVPLTVRPEAPPRRRPLSGETLLWAVPLALLALLLLGTVLVLALVGDDGQPATGEPSPRPAPSLAPSVSERLQDLRDAVEGR